MAPKVLSGTTLGPQMATKIHHRVPQNSPRALPSWPPSHTLTIISNVHSFLVPPSLELGSLGDARDRFWKPPGVNLRAYCHFIQLVALPCKLRASNLRGSAGRAEPIKFFSLLKLGKLKASWKKAKGKLGASERQAKNTLKGN